MRIFTDRDGDALVVIPRKPNRADADPVLSITHFVGKTGERTQSVLFIEKELPGIIINLLGAVKLNAAQLYEILDFVQGARQAAIAQEEKKS